MTDSIQITQKGYWVVNGTNHSAQTEAFQDAGSLAVASPGTVIHVQPPAFEVVYQKPPQPNDPPANVPLAAGFGVSQSGLTFAVTDTSAGATKVHYTFGDAKSADSAPGGTVTHTYPDTSIRTITQTVRDAAGNTATASKTVYPSSPPAGDPPPPPPPPPSDPAEPATARQAFPASALHWRDTDAAERVDVEIPFPDGSTPLHLDNVPVGVTPLQLPDGSPHDHLAVCRYRDGWVIENCWLDGKKNFVSNLVVKVNGETTFAQDNVNFWLHRGTAIQRQGLPQYTPGPIDRALLANYCNPGTLKSLRASWAHLDINGRGFEYYTDMGTASGRLSIGLIPGWDLPYALQGILWQDCRDANDHSPCWQRVRDPHTGMIVNPAAWPTASLEQIGADFGARGTNPVVGRTTCPYKPNAQHQTQYGIIPYLATGSDFDLEECLGWAAYQAALGTTRNYHGYEQCRVSTADACREVAWRLARLFYTWRILPDDHPYKAVYSQILDNNREYLTAQIGPGGPKYNAFGAWPKVEYNANLPAAKQKRGIAPWQNQFLAGALGLGVQLGRTDFTALRDWSLGFTINLMRNTCWQNGTVYAWYVVDPSKYGTGSNRHDPATWWPTWADMERDTYQHYADGHYASQLDAPCGQRTLPKAATGQMANSTGSVISFCANAQPAIAMAVDAGIEGAAEMWDQFAAHSGNIDYTMGITYGIVPRAA